MRPVWVFVLALGACTAERTATQPAELLPPELPPETMEPVVSPIDGVPDTEVDHAAASLRRRNGVFYFQGQPFDGYLVKQGEDGQNLESTPCLQGREHGWSQSWFDNGQLREQRYFTEGRKQGVHRGWWSDGSPRFLYQFRDGAYDGEQRMWHQNGQYAAWQNYQAGEEIGVQRSWSADGALLANYVVKNGRRYGRLGARPCVTVETEDE